MAGGICILSACRTVHPLRRCFFLSIGDWLILGLLAAALFFAVRYSIRNKGKCGGCAGCPHAEGCTKKEKEEP
ncbi:FeoB-associated Cys-rich membrane protein [Anaerotruncus sp. AF02-27]|uniref:FeoB-associated Cys-rich membrane protein n=1 Tax=Anaerotruncus sp. AF02-27 TaxID=2292191 RepID=UPI000E466CB4|nr:FeoB-associated Cys-rich membrane protein [Anaerotruncus sp. AF02-27]